MTELMTASAAAESTLAKWLSAIVSVLQVVSEIPGVAQIEQALIEVARGYVKAKVPRVVTKTTDTLVAAAYSAAKTTHAGDVTAAILAGYDAHQEAIRTLYVPYVQAAVAVNAAEDQHGKVSAEAIAARRDRATAKALLEAAIAGAVP